MAVFRHCGVDFALPDVIRKTGGAIEIFSRRIPNIIL
jgi:hypothetical protein